MNYSTIIRALGILLTLLGISMGVCYIIGEIVPANRPNAELVNHTGWLLSIVITICVGLVAFGVGKYKLIASRKTRVLRREAIAVVGLGWVICSVFSALPHLLSLENISWDRALFEACSGLTTTGSTIFPSVEQLPVTTLLWRSITQWMGGMGILGAFLLIFSGETKGKTLLSFESSIHGADLSSSDLRTAMRKLWQIYGALTLLCFIGLAMMDMTIFQALNHAMTTTSTAGFGTENDSISGFSNSVKLWLSGFMLACGISFPLYIAIIKKRSFNIIKKHEETRVYLALILISLIVLSICHHLSDSPTTIIDTLFNIVAIMTTTGYAVGDYDSWPALSKQFLMLMMIIGGCSGSTSGGLKVSRILLWIRAMKNEVIRGFRPNVVLKLQMNGRSVVKESIRNVYVVISIAVFFYLISTMALGLLEPELSAIGTASATLSAICNIGPAFAELGPTDNFSSLSPASLVILSGLMILGRLEFIAVLALFSRRLWRKY